MNFASDKRIILCIRQVKEYIVIIYTNLGPYHLARLKALAKLTPHLLAIEVGSKQGIYPWRPEKKNLPYVLETLFDQPVEEVSIKEQKKAIVYCLEKYNPVTVIVSGYGHPVMRIAASWARKKRGKDILLFSTTELDHPRVWWREWIKSRFIKKFHALAVSGKRSAQYAQKLGVAREKIFVIGNVVDNEHYQKLAKTFRANETEVRKTLKLPREFFLYVGRLSKEKNLPMLLKAFFSYQKSGGIWDLVLVGSGPEEEKLKEMASILNVHIHFAGWKQFEELVAYYALAKCFILPSMSETWGLVVNEAMACGLPILVSKNCGCVPELCKDGINGHIFDPKDVEQLASLMLSYSKGDFDLKKMRTESQRIITKYTPDAWARNLLKAISI